NQRGCGCEQRRRDSFVSPDRNSDLQRSFVSAKYSRSGVLCLRLGPGRTRLVSQLIGTLVCCTREVGEVNGHAKCKQHITPPGVYINRASYRDRDHWNPAWCYRAHLSE